jgi:hypothetical protein
MNITKEQSEIMYSILKRILSPHSVPEKTIVQEIRNVVSDIEEENNISTRDEELSKILKEALYKFFVSVLKEEDPNYVDVPPIETFMDNDSMNLLVNRFILDLEKSGKILPDGYVAVKEDPTPGLLYSMAIRADHGLACNGYYDSLSFPGGHQRRLEVALSEARKQHEEVTLQGFYSVDKEEEYLASLKNQYSGDIKDI